MFARYGVLLKSIFHHIFIVYGIMGGYDVTIEEAPYQVNYGDMCGGVLIHHQWAVTSAHCGIRENFIRVGSKHRLKGPKIKVISHLVHPKFGQSHTYDYDVQLLKLFKRLRFSQKVDAISITGGGYGDYIVVSGWGYPKEKGDYTTFLQQVKLNIVSMDRCQRVKQPYFNHTLTDRMFCAGGRGKDACQGDSGGGAVSLGQVIGISAFGFGCGRGLPGVYTNISHSDIRGWIRRHTGV